MSPRELAVGVALILALTLAPAANADAKPITHAKSCKGSSVVVQGKTYCVAPRPPVKPKAVR